MSSERNTPATASRLVVLLVSGTLLVAPGCSSSDAGDGAGGGTGSGGGSAELPGSEPAGVQIKGFAVALERSGVVELGLELSIVNDTGGPLVSCGQGRLTSGDFVTTVHLGPRAGSLCWDDDGVCVDQVDVSCVDCDEPPVEDPCKLPQGATAVVKMKQHFSADELPPGGEGSAYDLELKFFDEDGDPVEVSTAAEL
jgi:hypothetical protein